MDHLTSEQMQEVQNLRAGLPRQVGVHVLRSEDGGFVADVVTLPGVITEAETFSELINMVNDAIITHYEVPEQYRAFLPAYLPPFKAAQDLGLFPVQRVEEEVTLNLAVGEAPTR